MAPQNQDADTRNMVVLDSIDKIQPSNLLVRQKILVEEVTKKIIEMGALAPAMSSCPICGSENIEQFAFKFGLNIDRCQECDFRFTNPPPSSEQLQIYYNSDAKRQENDVFQNTLSSRLPIFTRRVEIIQKYCSGGTLLDVGGAIGIFVDALRAAEAPFDVTIVDLNADAIERVHQRHPAVPALNMSIFDHHQSYDVVTLFDTLEHLPDVNRVARHLFDLLNPGGYLFIAAPNMASFEYSVGQQDHPQVSPLARVNYFSPLNLRNLLERHGFKVIDFVTPNGSFDVAYVKRMLAENTAKMVHLGEFLRRQLQSKDFADDFAWLISHHRLAGSMVVVSQRPGE